MVLPQFMIFGDELDFNHKDLKLIFEVLVCLVHYVFRTFPILIKIYLLMVVMIQNLKLRMMLYYSLPNCSINKIIDIHWQRQ